MTNPFLEAENSIKDLVFSALETEAPYSEADKLKISAGKVEILKDSSKGDFSSTHAMAFSGLMHMPPSKAASYLAEKISLDGSCFRFVEAADPGYINFRLSHSWYENVLKNIDAEGSEFGADIFSYGKKALILFVPDLDPELGFFEKNRGMMLFAAMASVFKTAGYEVSTENRPAISDFGMFFRGGSRFDRVLIMCPSLFSAKAYEAAAAYRENFECRRCDILIYNSKVNVSGGSVGGAFSLPTQNLPHDCFLRQDTANFFLNSCPRLPALLEPELAVRHDMGNPFYYIRYACSRIRSFSENFAAEGITAADVRSANLSLLIEPEELELIKKLAFFPETIRRSAEKNDPSLINGCLTGIAGAFYRFYYFWKLNKERKDLLEARLFLSECTGKVLENAIAVIGAAKPKKI